MGLVAWREIAFQGFFQGIVIGVVSGLLYTRAVVLLGAPRTALCTAAVPGLTLVAALCWLDERPSSWVWLGAGLVTVGMLVGLLGRSTRPAPA